MAPAKSNILTEAFFGHRAKRGSLHRRCLLFPGTLDGVLALWDASRLHLRIHENADNLLFRDTAALFPTRPLFFQCNLETTAMRLPRLSNPDSFPDE